MSEHGPPTVVGRYVLHAPIARGGMATIHLARLLGAEGFSRMVAAKRLHPQFTGDPEFLAMFLDEARIASKVHHPNVVPVLDVLHTGSEVVLVQEYVHGVPLDKLLRAAREAHAEIPASVVVAVAADMLAGLHAAHEATDELGAPLGIIHRDVSPQNVLVGVDGIARLLDFGVAKAEINAHVTRAGTFKGKLNYTSPEQMRGESTRATDLYAAGVVVWEALAGRRMHAGRTEAELCASVTAGHQTRLLSAVDPATVLPERWAHLARLDPVVARGLELSPEDRWPTARAMADALGAAVAPATAAEVSRWVKLLGKTYLEGRERLIVSEESTWRQRASAVPQTTPGAPAESETGATLRPSALPVPKPRRRVERALAAAIVILGGFLTVVLVLLLRRPEAPATAQPQPGAAAAMTPAPVTAAPEVAPSPPPTPAAAPAAVADAAPPVHARLPLLPLARAVPAAPSPPRPAAPSAAPAPDCNPPFYFDGKKKVFKAGCL